MALRNASRGTPASNFAPPLEPGQVSAPAAPSAAAPIETAVVQQAAASTVATMSMSPIDVIAARENALAQLLGQRQQLVEIEQKQLEENQARRDQINQQLLALAFGEHVEGPEVHQPTEPRAPRKQKRKTRKYTHRAAAEVEEEVPATRAPRITGKRGARTVARTTRVVPRAPRAASSRGGKVNKTSLIIKQIFQAKYRNGTTAANITKDAVAAGLKLGVDILPQDVSSALQAGRRKKPQPAIIVKGDARDYTYYANPKYERPL